VFAVITAFGACFATGAGLGIATAEDAAFFGCAPEVTHARTILQRGTSADRQLERYAKVKSEGGSERDALVAVVDELVAETAAVPGAGMTTILEGENAKTPRR